MSPKIPVFHGSHIGFKPSLTITSVASMLIALFLSVETASAQANSPPVALCQNVTANADASCVAVVTANQVDAGSFDPDGDPTLRLRSSYDGVAGFGEGTIIDDWIEVIGNLVGKEQ